MNDCIFPSEIMIMIAHADDSALLRLSLACKSLFVEFHAHKLVRCVRHYKCKDKHGNVIHLYTNIYNKSKVIQSIKYVDRINAIIVVWLNIEGRMNRYYSEAGQHWKRSTPWRVGCWGDTGFYKVSATEYFDELNNLLNSGVHDYNCEYEQTIWDPVHKCNVYTEDLIDTWESPNRHNTLKI